MGVGGRSVKPEDNGCGMDTAGQMILVWKFWSYLYFISVDFLFRWCLKSNGLFGVHIKLLFLENLSLKFAILLLGGVMGLFCRIRFAERDLLLEVSQRLKFELCNLT